MRMSCGGTLRPPRMRRIASARVAFQRQRAPNIGAASSACVSTYSTLADLTYSKTISSGNACWSVSESTMPLSVAAACSSKLNERQNVLRSANPHARLMRAPNGVCRINCMPPPSSKNRSATIVSIGRNDAEDLLARRGRRRRPVPRRRDRARIRACSSSQRVCILALVDRGAQRATSCESSIVRPGPSPFQNGIVGAAPCASSTRTTPGFHAPDAPRVRAEQKHVAGHAFDREIFVERPDDVAFGLRDDVVVRGFGNGAAGRDRRHARAAPAAHAAVDAVVMQKCAAAPARCGDAVGQHRHHVVEIFALEIAIRICACARDRRARRRPVFGRACRDDLLRENVERRGAEFAARRVAPLRTHGRTSAAHSSSSSRVVANRRPSGFAPTQCPERPMRCSATAIERGEPSCTTRSIVPMSIPSSSDAVATTARSSPFFKRVLRFEARFARKTAVMRHHDALAQTLGQRERDALAHPARADEHQRRAVRANQLRDAVVDLGPHLVACDGPEFVARNFDGESPFRVGCPTSTICASRTEESRDVFQRTDRGGKPDALRLAPAVADAPVRRAARA